MQMTVVTRAIASTLSMDSPFIEVSPGAVAAS